VKRQFVGLKESLCPYYIWKKINALNKDMKIKKENGEHGRKINGGI